MKMKKTISTIVMVVSGILACLTVISMIKGVSEGKAPDSIAGWFGYAVPLLIFVALFILGRNYGRK